ncbi:MAG: hypothetical protein RL190_1817 [Actinomycetota bacterium]
MALIPFALHQAGLGAGWFALGAANLVVVYATGAEPALGWRAAALIAVVAALVGAMATVRTLRTALAQATPAAGIPLGTPADAFGRCVVPVGAVMGVLLVLALVPGLEPAQGLAALVFAAVGTSYGPLALWVRRFEEMQGVIIAVPLNRWGLRVGPVQALRLPR